jgi:hypothetical protein
MDQADCLNCGHASAQLWAGRCSPCHQYWQRWKQERPLNRQQGRPCQDCGQLTGAYGRLRCPACLQQHSHHRAFVRLGSPG